MVVAYFVLESVLVVKVLGEMLPMSIALSLTPNSSNTDHPQKTERLVAAALLFAIGQIFNFVISVHLCDATSGKIDGALFETAFTLCAVVMLWFFWSSITEDEWPDDPMNPMMSESGMPYA